MIQETVKCAHTCRNACGMLNEALREETALVRFYEGVLSQCDYPDVHGFLQELVEERSRSAIRILQKLNELRARADTMDGIISSFDPAGC
ncbi:MAG: hypothetical protein WBD36_11900 [Bacteroidota bacterium]